MRDPYETLGVARDAKLDAIRKAYRKLARKHHPDLNPGDKAAEERFKEISRAWEVLEDPVRRRNYDEFGEISLEVGFDAERARQAREAFGSRFGTGARTGAESFGEEFEFGDLDDLLGRYFSGRGEGRPNMRLRGPDVEATLELDFLDAVRGGEQRLTMARPSGGGSETITVRIPPGVDTGGRLRIPGKGGPGIGGGSPGDLSVVLHVRPHRVFRRDGRDLTFDLPVRVTEAIRGAKVEVPTLDGRATLTIPPGTDSGTRLRLRGKGVPDPHGGPPGDLFARVQIRVPRDLDAEAKRALDALERAEDREIRKELFMTRRSIRTSEVLIFLGAEEKTAFFQRLREEGLFESDELAPEEADELRLAKLLMEELGVNAEGVGVALHLRRRLFALELRARALADALDQERRKG